LKPGPGPGETRLCRRKGSGSRCVPRGGGGATAARGRLANLDVQPGSDAVQFGPGRRRWMAETVTVVILCRTRRGPAKSESVDTPGRHLSQSARRAPRCRAGLAAAKCATPPGTVTSNSAARDGSGTLQVLPFRFAPAGGQK
jgi:hypothetical protein